MFKILKNFSVPLMRELFRQKVNHYDLRNPYEFYIPNGIFMDFADRNDFIGQGSILYLGPLIL